MGEAINAVVMPKLGLSMTEGIVAKWNVSEGDKISTGDVIADIETSKITNELEVYEEGAVLRLVAEEGAELPVGALIAVIGDGSAAIADIDQFISEFVPEDVDDIEPVDESGVADDVGESPKTRPGIDEKRASTTPAADSIPEELQGDEDDSGVSATYLARKLARNHGVNLLKIIGSGRRGRVSKRDIQTAVEKAGGSLVAKMGSVAASGDDSSVPATPLARRLARQVGVNLYGITATGSRGRVTRADVEKATQRGARTSKTKPTAEECGICEELHLSSMRQVIAERLTESKQQAPHFRLTIEADIDAMLGLRADLNSDEDLLRKLSVNDFIVKAVAETLLRVPEVNIQFDGKLIRRFAHADVAVAVALEEGLVTPIIRAADTKAIHEISEEMAVLAGKAKSGTLKPDEFEGGTFTVSNLGMFGIKTFDAIINPPQASILAVGAAEKRRIVMDSGDKVASMLGLTLSCDHRVIDGALGARFLQSLKHVIENPARMII